MLVARAHKIAAAIAFVLLTAWLLIGSWQSSRHQPAEARAAYNGANKNEAKPQEGEFWNWLTHDAAGFFTLWLVLVGGGQVGLFLWQLRLIGKSLTDAKIAAEAAKTAANAGTRQAKVAEDAFTKLERPYVFIFDVSKLAIDTKSPVGNPTVYVTYSVANYGKTPAIIKHAGGIMHAAKHTGAGETGPDTPVPFPYNHNLIISPIIAADEVRTDLVQSVPSSLVGFVFDETGDDLIPQIGPYDDFFLWIIVSYRGPFTDHHETSVCWRWNEGDGRFIKHGKNNWEK
jgi:hypothetical protein